MLRLSLDTSAGPSWKPLPVVVTAPLSLTGGAAAALWLIVARAGGLLALAGAARVAWRLTGSGIAAATAAAVMALGPWWWFNTALGNSEGLLAASVLWAIAAHLEGRPRLALGLLLAAALMRPEAWAFLGLYGLWLWRADPGARRLVAVAFAAVPLLWFGPDVIGAGGAIGASKAARANASVGSAALSDHPALTVLADAVRQLTLPAALAALAGVVLGPAAARRLGLAALVWVVEVAVMTAAGYAGNPRYLDAAAAVGCALAGVGVAAVGARVAASKRTASAAAAAAGLAVMAGMLAVGLDDLRAQTRQLGVRADRREDLETLLARTGGPDRLRACGTVRASESMRTLVSWRVDVPLMDLETQPVAPGAALLASPYEGGQDKPILDAAARRRFPVITRQGAWVLRASCPQFPADGAHAGPAPT